MKKLIVISIIIALFIYTPILSWALNGLLFILTFILIIFSSVFIFLAPIYKRFKRIIFSDKIFNSKEEIDDICDLEYPNSPRRSKVLRNMLLKFYFNEKSKKEHPRDNHERQDQRQRYWQNQERSQGGISSSFQNLNCLKTLKLIEKSNRNLKQLKINYRKLAKIHHPDAGGVEAKFHELNNCYEKLKKTLN